MSASAGRGYGPPGRSRCTLAMSRLPEFEAHCVSKGWTKVPIKGEYEVLRMTKKGEEPMIAHAKLGPLCTGNGHATTWGRSARLLQSWLDTRKNQSALTQTPTEAVKK